MRKFGRTKVQRTPRSPPAPQKAKPNRLVFAGLYRLSLTEACGWNEVPGNLIRDRDAYGDVF
ncbi:MAG TPA: hypothetical protein VGG61_05110, partial [Gemmataceae bacterium]